MSHCIYHFEVVEGQEWLVPLESGDYDRFFSMDGRVIRDWDPPAMRILTHDDSGRMRTHSDFPWLGEHVPIFAARAVASLGRVALQYGQLLPLRGQEAWLYNVTNVVDALDEGRSRITYFDDGTILAIEEYAFKWEKIGASEIFKLPVRASPVFVTHRFCDRVRDSGLVGVSFKLLSTTPDQV